MCKAHITKQTDSYLDSHNGNIHLMMPMRCFAYHEDSA